MSFVVMDSEGSTIETFDRAEDARSFLMNEIEADPIAGDELAVLRYEDGHREGAPENARRFVDFWTQQAVNRTVAVALSGVSVRVFVTRVPHADEPIVVPPPSRKLTQDKKIRLQPVVSRVGGF